MKKILVIFILSVLLPFVAAAQVEKSVEVTKVYVPGVDGAMKLPVAPDMVDTVMMRPDIDYSITPLSMQTRLTTRPIRPATVTYWEFNRPRPFYLKLGAGWPLNTLGDFYASTQNPGTGYLLGYVNHRGEFGNLPDCAWMPDVAFRARQMQTKVGAAAGKYLGRHMLEGEFSYENRYYYRSNGNTNDELQWRKAWNNNDFGVHIRFGDDFTDLSRLNFNIGLRGRLYTATEMHYWRDELKGRLTHLGVDGALARAFGRHTLRLDVMYEHGAGVRAISEFRQDVARAGLRYGFRSRVVTLDLGADYWYDELSGRATKHYVIPAVHLLLNVGTRAFVPFFEADGTLRDNNLRTLTRENPYMSWAMLYENYYYPSNYDYRQTCNQSTVDYNFRIGAGGSVGGDRFSYRVYGQTSVVKNQIYWAGVNEVILPFIGDQTVWSLVAEVEYRPASRFMLGARVSVFGYDDKSVKVPELTDREPLPNGSPNITAMFKARYTAPKFSFGVRADLQGRREWLYYVAGQGAQTPTSYQAPLVVDVSADIDWRVARALSLFGEVHNIANMKVYDFPLYRGYGINFTAGVKLVF